MENFFENTYLQKDSPVPLYYQLKEIFLSFVKTYPDGTSFPTENEICRHFQVSRPTVRQAMKELENEGLIQRIKAKGTVVHKSYTNVKKIYQNISDEKIYFPLNFHYKSISLDTKKVGISVFTHRAGYFQVLKDTLAEELSRFHINEIITDANDSAKLQIRQLDGLINQNVDLILLDPVTPPTELNFILEKIYNHNIPVIAINSMVDGQAPILTYVGCDSFELGSRIGIHIGNYLLNRYDKVTGNVVIIEGDPSNIAGEARGRGMIHGISLIDPNHTVKVLEKIPGYWMKEKGKEAVCTVLKKYKDIDVIFSYSDTMTIGCIEATIESHRKDIIFSSIDGSKEALQNMSQGGQLKAIGINDPVRIGKLGANIAALFLDTGLIPSKKILTEPIIITPETVHAFYDSKSPF
jgi:ABC-type sugar transport system substrate-binding protein